MACYYPDPRVLNYKGSLQLDMSYASILVFGQPKKLYEKTLMKYVVSSQERPQNFPIYSVHFDMDSFILYNAKTNPSNTLEFLAVEPKENQTEKSSVLIQGISDNKAKPDENEKPNPIVKQIPTTPDTNYEHEILWHLEFDGSVNKLGAEAGVWVYNLQNDHAEGHAYRLNFRCTNNMAEYEALLLGLKLVKRLGAIRVSTIGDSELIIKQIKGKYLTRDPRIGYYRGTVIEILNTFLETQLATIPRKHNLQAHNLAMFSSTCKLPFQTNHQFTAKIRHRPSIPNNLKNWQVFYSDEQINNFLTLGEEFSNSNIDVDTFVDSNPIDEVEINIS